MAKLTKDALKGGFQQSKTKSAASLLAVASKAREKSMETDVKLEAGESIAEVKAEESEVEKPAAPVSMSRAKKEAAPKAEKPAEKVEEKVSAKEATPVVKRTFYITEKQNKALDFYSMMNPKECKTDALREALDEYLEKKGVYEQMKTLGLL